MMIIIIIIIETDNKCTLCKQFDETAELIKSACPIFAKEQHTKRHDRKCAQLYFNISKEIGVKLDNEHWCDRVPKPVETSQMVRLTYYGTNKGEPTELFLTVNRTS